MNTSGIKLNMDMESIQFMNGSVPELASGNGSDYFTRIDMVIPQFSGKVPEGVSIIDYNNQQVEVRVSTIRRIEEDPILSNNKNLKIGSSGSGLDTIPFVAFTDNRGEYPTTLCSIIFPRRIASWIDPSHETGLNMQHDYEKWKVTGSPPIEEKVESLVVLNRLLERHEVKKPKSIGYDDVTPCVRIDVASVEN